jgi:hypothetical protein
MLKEWAAARLAGTRDVKSDDRRRKKLGLSGVWLKIQWNASVWSCEVMFLTIEVKSQFVVGKRRVWCAG